MATAKTKETIGLEALADLLVLDVRRVQQLANEDIVKKAKRGEYELVPSVQGYIQYLRQQSGNSISGIVDQRLRVMKTKADKEELEFKLLSGDMVDKADAVSCWSLAVQMMKTELLGIPSKAAQAVRVAKTDAEGKQILERFIKRALTKIANVEIRSAASEDPGE